MEDMVLKKALEKVDTSTEMDERILGTLTKEMNREKKAGRKGNAGYRKIAAVLLTALVGTAAAGYVAAKTGNSYYEKLVPVDEKDEKTESQIPGGKRVKCKVNKAFQMMGVKNLLPTYSFRQSSRVTYWEYDSGAKSIAGDCVTDHARGHMQFYYSPEKTELDEDGNAVSKVECSTEWDVKAVENTKYEYYTTRNGWKCTILEGPDKNLSMLISIHGDYPEGGSFIMLIQTIPIKEKKLHKILDSIPALDEE